METDIKPKFSATPHIVGAILSMGLFVAWYVLEHTTNFRIGTSRQEPVSIWIIAAGCVLMLVLSFLGYRKHRDITLNGKYVHTRILKVAPKNQNFVTVFVTYQHNGKTYESSTDMTKGNKNVVVGGEIWMIMDTRKPERLLYNFSCAKLANKLAANPGVRNPV